MATLATTQVINYLKQNDLVLTTAESCTAGLIIAQLSDVDGSGAVLECGYVVYSEAAKKRLLAVKQTTIDRFNLTSEEVAREMAAGALNDSTANVAVATTGVAGPDAVDGIAPGTVCFAWAFQLLDRLHLISETRRFHGNRHSVQKQSAHYAIEQISPHHRSLRAVDGPGDSAR